MSRILIYDDDSRIVEFLKSAIRSEELTPIVFTDIKLLKDYIYKEESWEDVKGLIFDLAQKKEEDEGITDFEILEDIEWCYQNRRVPILIHSAYAEELDILKKYPSVLLFKKGATSIRNVKKAINILKESGFFDLFCESDLLKDEIKQLNLELNWGDELLKRHLHDSFIDNFQNKDIISELSKIINEGGDVKRMTYLKCLKPYIDNLKNL